MTENDVNETSQIESLEPSPGGPITDGLTVNEDEPSPGSAQRGRGSGMSWATLLLAFVIGLLIGYVARPFTDQLAIGGQSDPSANAQQSATSEPADEIALAEEETPESSPPDQVKDESPALPVLITPTPDLSGEIAAAILPNVRHFIGDVNAPVTLIEFSDFQ